MCGPTDTTTTASQPRPKLRSSLSQKRCGLKKSVSFGTIESKTFETIRGQHRGDVQHPLALGWTCVEHSDAVSVDQYELDRAPERAPFEELLTDPRERKRMIKNSEQQRLEKNGGERKQRKSLPGKVFKYLMPKRAASFSM